MTKMVATSQLLSTDNPTFCTFIFFSCILTMKIIFMACLTSAQRYKRRVLLCNDEFKTYGQGDFAMMRSDDVARTMNARLDDLEQIPIFFMTGLGFIMTNPPVEEAVFLFRLVATGRILHTILSLGLNISQPIRGVGFVMAFASTLYMALITVFNFINYM